jgi:hypothetical protein
MVECANAYTGDAVHFNMPYQAADDWITYCANYARDNLTGGKEIYIELGNETSFNGVYDSYHQCQNEAFDPTLVAGVAITSITKGTPFSLGTTGNISSGSTTISGIASLTGVTPGMMVAGTGIQANTIVKAVFSGQVTISLAATATTTGVSLTFSGCPATLVTSSAHGLSSTEVGAITGASPADYNTTYTQLVVVNSTTLTITCPTTPATNATVVGAYTHSGYPSLGVGQIAGYLRYIDASRRMANIWMTAFAGQTSRIKPMLCWQHVDPSNTAQAMSYANSQGWLTNFKAYASAPYWSASPTYDATYTGTASAFFTASRSNIDTTMYNNAVSHASNATTYGLEYVTYEGDFGHGINDLTTITNIKTDAGMYDTVLYYYQKMQLAGLSRVCAFNFCQPIASGPNGPYGHIFPSLLGVTVNKTNTPGLQAIVDYLAGTRLLYDCTLKNGSLSFHLNDADGTIGGRLDFYVVGATLSLNDPSGHFDIDQSGNIKVKTGNGGTLPAGSYTIGVVQTVPTGKGADGIDTITTNLTATVASYALFNARYIRLSASANSGDPNPCVAVAEFEVATSAGGANVATSATASGLFWTTGFETSKAIDADPATYWVSNIDATWPKVITLDFGASSGNWPRPAEIRIQDRTGNVGQGPGTFTIDISPDNTTWTTIISKTGETWTAGQKKTYSV